jgi:dTDP-4-dehydrorhamnose reductase
LDDNRDWILKNRNIPRTLITGANGMLGSKLTEYFNKFCTVIAVDRDESIFAQKLDAHVVDLTNESATAKLIKLTDPDIIIHCAGLVNVDNCEKDPELADRTNVDATRYLAQASSDESLFIYVSTDQVYGDIPNQPEANTSLSQLNQYAITKYQGEEVVRELCPRYIIARTNIFGWNMQKGRVSSAEWIINSVVSGESIFLFHDYIFSPIYVGLFAEIMQQLIKREFYGTINLGARDHCSKHDFGMALIKGLRLNPKNINSQSLKDHKFLGARSPDMRMNVEKLVSLGILPPSYMESIDAFISDPPANY